MDKETVPAYIGFDCTAPSLHVGSLVQIMMLRRLQQSGHKPIVVMGGGTTKVGDPSGKDESRKLLSDEMIEKNVDLVLLAVRDRLEDESAGVLVVLESRQTQRAHIVDIATRIAQHVQEKTIATQSLKSFIYSSKSSKYGT